MAKFSSKEQLKKDKVSLIFMATGLLALIIFFAVVFPKDREDRTQFGSSDDRLRQTEERLLSQLKVLEDRLAHLEERDQSFKQMIHRLDGLNASLSSKVAHMEKIVESLQKKVPASGPTRVPDVPRRRTALRYHRVQTGDTLYQISRAYGLTVDELRHMNNLAPEAAIKPGQKLIVK